MRYRPNVAALMTDPQGRLLICERWNIPGAWQFPQGGVDPGESLRQALVREVREEIGLCERDYEILEMRGGYRYEYPPDVLARKLRKHGHHGQEQTYFRCRLAPDAGPIDLDRSPREFRAYTWIPPAGFQLAWLPVFKRDVYRAVIRDFFGVVIE
jgi:putative (di)nucleoside polyphosphate hydrolase